MTRTLSVWVGAQIIYLYGTVNGEAATFTLIGSGEWQATVPRAEGDNYVLHLEAYSANGLEGIYDYTLYYGMIPCITDRTSADVKELRQLVKRINNAGGWEFADEIDKARFSESMKGAYNATDFNRVDHNVDYLAGRLCTYGYTVEVTTKKDWSIVDIPRTTDIAQYLSNLEVLKAAFYGSIELPKNMDKLTPEAANNIELLLCEIEQNINNMVAAWYYSGELFSGEV